MILTFELVKPEAVSDERLFALMHRARQIAIEIDGVYDLALYRTERPTIWQCSIDTEDEQAWKLLQSDPHFREVCEAVQRLGVSITLENQLERQI
ncbi:MAG: hypothetical protein K6T71_02000 [Candidatus Bipolaricaulota bacterium]|nr:hypothetical protein [Candidatus Bipolaricaulota bacterium]